VSRGQWRRAAPATASAQLHRASRTSGERVAGVRYVARFLVRGHCSSCCCPHCCCCFVKTQNATQHAQLQNCSMPRCWHMRAPLRSCGLPLLSNSAGSCCASSQHHNMHMRLAHWAVGCAFESQTDANACEVLHAASHMGSLSISTCSSSMLTGLSEPLLHEPNTCRGR
jgi:hypothetical protein